MFWCFQGVKKWNIGWKWVNINDLKVRPDKDQTEICYYKNEKITLHLKSLTKNEFISNTLDLPPLLRVVEMSEDKEDISYDVEFLFTNTCITETIDFSFNKKCVYN